MKKIFVEMIPACGQLFKNHYRLYVPLKSRLGLEQYVPRTDSQNCAVRVTGQAFESRSPSVLSQNRPNAVLSVRLSTRIQCGSALSKISVISCQPLVKAMPGNLSRRLFLGLIGALPLIQAVWPKLSPPVEAQGAEAHEWLDGVDYPEQSPAHAQCPECGGLGGTVCLACDGTGLWSEASESAGLYERERARRTGHCAWCDERGEAECTLCCGKGVFLTVRADSLT
jgi:hypothetical protein